RVRLPALGRSHDHGRAGRRRTTVRRPRRCGRVHDRASLLIRPQSDLLAILARAPARRRRAVCAWRHPGRHRHVPRTPARHARMTTPALRTAGLSKSFGAFRANSDVSLAFPHGVRHALIGPNGAGKTTLINLLTGALVPTAGDVFLGDERITALSQHQRVKLGMTRTFQINTLFAGLTVLESVTLAIC